jgi:hypothetical protein
VSKEKKEMMEVLLKEFKMNDEEIKDSEIVKRTLSNKVIYDRLESAVDKIIKNRN